MKSKHQNPKCFGTTPTNTFSLLFYLTSLTLAILLISHLSNNNNKNTNIERFNRTNTSHRNTTSTCDLFKGQWIPDSRAPLYSNSSCKTIPFKTNCFLHGRNDTGFLHWRWKPDNCELPRFSPEKFLESMQGKTVAFIGDSIARNQMESLLCLLSTVETPTRTEKDPDDPDDRFATWEFPTRSFTLTSLWSQFLVESSERHVNGSFTGGFHVHLDRADPAWTTRLPSLDYAVFSAAPWFFRQNYLYEGGRLIGCVYCRSPDAAALPPGVSVRRAFRTAFRAVTGRRTVAVVRTYSPSHFENGTWDTGGVCGRTGPTGRRGEVDRGGVDWKYRTIQVEEVERAKKEGGIRRIEVLDVTGMMGVRKDGHPGVHWENKWIKGYSDCIHWCLPGPIDVWNQLLFEVIKRRQEAS